mgnify:CR=1 FL=1|tara:strand:+ start:1172 stop:1495 length:324 start_codon:yes stop_codon:yes gene_type:complete
MNNEISYADLKKAIDLNKVILIEALPREYYLDGHLPRALQINYNEIREKLEKLPSDKGAFIVTYCASETCPNSRYAQEILTDLGYRNVKKYSGGKQDWLNHNEILEK